jgi:hypothetical protein
MSSASPWSASALQWMRMRLGLVEIALHPVLDQYARRRFPVVEDGFESAVSETEAAAELGEQLLRRELERLVPA